MKSSEVIEIEVDTRYLEEHSRPEDNRFAFAYTVAITNRGETPVKLMNRHWQITDEENRVEEVSGEGVVGQQPEIQPGQSFEYTSGAVIGTEMGTMKGSYEMLCPDGSRFEAPIAPFLLALPRTLH